MDVKAYLKKKILTHSTYLWKVDLRNQALKTPISEDYKHEPEAKIIKSIIRHNEVFFDIGANNGFYSCIVENVIGSKNLYMFEPVPRLYNLLKKRFRNANVFNIALSDKSGLTKIKIPYIQGRLYETRATLETDIIEEDQTGLDEIRITRVTLDEFIHLNNIPKINYLKIDVEGHEQKVIAGGKNTIIKYAPILLVEIEQRHHKEPVKNIFNYIESFGYSGFYLNISELKLHPISDYDIQYQPLDFHRQKKFIHYINNFLFFPNDSLDRILNKINSSLNFEREKVDKYISESK